ncbi:MAG: metallophosphoesterase, partial [Candidatus Pacearchaeota archaeon]
MTHEYKIIDKSIYFPKQEILALGDLHLGYEEMLKAQGLFFPLNQLQTTKEDIEKIMEKLRKRGHGLKKIILLGDIKHHFSFDIGEKISIRAFLKFLTKYVSNQNIIVIKGNHDTIEMENKKYHKYYIKDGLAFTHGDKTYEEIFSEEVKAIVMSHIHPAAIIRDPEGVKREKFKCFLIGRYKEKKIIITPSFLPMVEGSEINEYEDSSKWEQVVPKENLSNFETLILGEDKVYNFGEYGGLN